VRKQHWLSSARYKAATKSQNCNEQRIHPGRRLRRFEKFGQILLRQWGFSSTLALHILLLATLLILMFLLLLFTRVPHALIQSCLLWVQLCLNRTKETK